MRVDLTIVGAGSDVRAAAITVSQSGRRAPLSNVSVYDLRGAATMREMRAIVGLGYPVYDRIDLDDYVPG